MDVREGDDLLGFVKRFAAPETMAVEEDLGHGYVRLRVTEAERRQALQDIRSVEDVVKELVRNARDAGATQVFVSFQKEKGRWRQVTVLDDGCGIPEDLHRRIFEARVTSKVEDVLEDRFGVHGRGMALFSIKQVADEVRLVNSVVGRGTAIHVRVDTRKVQERKDQSTFPRLEKDEEGRTVVAGGPHNVLRVLTEFAIGSPEMKVFLGSHSEILATLYHRSLELRKSWAAGEKEARRPLWFDLGGIREGRALHRFALEELGLPVSERNAFRILEYEIPPLMSIGELLEREGGQNCSRRADLLRRSKAEWGEQLSRRLRTQDLRELGDELHRLFREVGSRYYLEVERPVIKRRKDKLIITLRLHESEDCRE